MYLNMFPWILLDAHGDGIALITPDGSIVFVNETIAQTTGHSADELIGASVWDLYPVDRAKHRRIVVHRVIETGQPVLFVDRFADRWYETLVQPLWDEGQIRHIVLYSRNITLQEYAPKNV